MDSLCTFQFEVPQRVVVGHFFFLHRVFACTSLNRCRGWDVAQLVEHRTGTLSTLVRFPGAARGFCPRVNFQRRLSYDVRTPPCAVACVYICARVKDSVVHVRVRWIMETLKHPACAVGWVARLCRSWLSLRKGNPNLLWEKSHCDNTVVKNQSQKSKKRSNTKRRP